MSQFQVKNNKKVLYTTNRFDVPHHNIIINQFIFIKQIKIMGKEKINLDMDLKQISRNQQEGKNMTNLTLFKFITKFNFILIIIGTLCACGIGVFMQFFPILWGNTIDLLSSKDENVYKFLQVMINYILAASGVIFLHWAMLKCWKAVAQRYSIAYRKQYFKLLLKQQIEWFDSNNRSQQSIKFISNSSVLNQAIEDKIPKFIMAISIIITGLIIIFIKSWLITLVYLISIFFIAIGRYINYKLIQKKEKDFQSGHINNRDKFQQSFNSIQTIKQLNGENYQINQYKQSIKKIPKRSIQNRLFNGIKMGGMIILASIILYSLSWWYESNCFEETFSCLANLNGNSLDVDTLIIFFNIFITGISCLQISPILKSISEGRAAASRIYQIIDRLSEIKSKQKLQSIFSTALCHQIERSEVAIFQLILRYYDPSSQKTTFDNNDVQQLDIEGFRPSIGYIQQQLICFMIFRHNLLFGIEQVSDQTISYSLTKAQAQDSIYKLKTKIDNYIAGTVNQFPVVQKQRLLNPMVFLIKLKALLQNNATQEYNINKNAEQNWDIKIEKNIEYILKKMSKRQSIMTMVYCIQSIIDEDNLMLNKVIIAEKVKMFFIQKYQNIKRNILTNLIYSSIQQSNIYNQKANNCSSYKQLSKDKDQNTLETMKFQQYVPEKQTFSYLFSNNNNKQENIAEINDQQEYKYNDDNNKEDLIQKQKIQIKKQQKNKYGGLLKYIADKKLYFSLGILLSIGNGFIYPILNVILIKMVDILFNISNNHVLAKQNFNNYSVIFLILGIGSFILALIQQITFEFIGNSITQQIREDTYLKILKMPIPWLNRLTKDCDNLASSVSEDCKQINKLVTVFIVLILQAIVAVVTSLTIILYFDWRISLVIIVTISSIIIITSFVISSKQISHKKLNDFYQNCMFIISQYIENIKDLVAFGNQKLVNDNYKQKLKQSSSLKIEKDKFQIFYPKFLQYLIYLSFTLIFFLTAIILKDHHINIINAFISIYIIMFTMMHIVNIFIYLPKVFSAKDSVDRLLYILNSQDQDQMQIRQHSKLLNLPILGHIIFQDIDFKYQGREEYVFKRLNLEIKGGYKICLVGNDKYCRQAIFHLLQRFYQPQSGQIFIDGNNIKDFDIHYLRQCFGVINQEPVLFNDSIIDNIKYNKYQLMKEDIMRAARQAKLNHFIEFQQRQVLQSDQNNFDHQEFNDLQNQGLYQNISQMSIGQRQRIAIARTAIRRPKVIMINESISPYDYENEFYIRTSLDMIMRNKTSLIIANRIHTIMNCDQIIVFQNGELVQQGTYNQLIANQDHFYRLQNQLAFF